MVRGILVVLGGYVAMAALVMLGTVLATAMLVPGGLAAMRAARTGGGGTMPTVGASYLVANLVVSLLAAMVGGWIVQRYAPGPAFPWVCGLAGLLLVLGVALAAKGPQGGQPAWYAYLIPVIGVAGVLAGSTLLPH